MNKTKSSYNILICGTGGQGVLLASEIIGIAVLNAGFHVKKSEVHGMAQRGGSVESHVRFGKNISSPLIMPGCADFLICFHEGEGKRNKVFLKKGGLDFTPFLKEAANLPDSRFINTLFLGILAAHLPVSREHWYAAIDIALKKKLDENKAIFDKGMELGSSLM